MKKFSTDKLINELVHQCLKNGWRWRSGKKHDILIAPNNRRMAIPSSPSDMRARHNFQRDIRALSAENR
ncbi:hypothetical protein F480_02355 [Bibersteinia trehalosi Y31]|uniref:Type II toxin-antitoxin system HicA family toxin n=1 Tax=Bibersteinia trehalosi Y31 TaxID=1261658 RepID=A0A179CZZ6_BIBTR|nr:hypothetical protein [Bibersteinia trehalosi]OAQ15402.1 hypothetical protein F480_02355 [Bibersteinia trehalosi Y31]